MAEPADGTRYRIPCPHCGQLIVPKSARCRHCDREVHAATPAPPADVSADEAYRVACPECQGPIVPKAVECRWCGSKLDGPRPVPPAAPAVAPPPPPAPAPAVDPLLAPPPAAPPAEPERVPCPQCRELVMKDAIKCRFCGSNLRAPASPALRRATRGAAEERSLQGDVTRALVASIVGTVCLGPCGIVLGPVMLLMANNYRTRAARLRVPVPGANAGILVCGVINILFGVLVLGAIAAGGLSTEGVVHVDHDYDVALTVEVDSVVLGTVPPDGHERFKIKAGSHLILVRNARGEVLEKTTVNVDRRGRYLLNPGARCTYEVETARYSTRPGVDPFGVPATSLPKASWTDITRFDYAFEPFPQNVTLGKYESTATKTRVGRAGRTH